MPTYDGPLPDVAGLPWPWPGRDVELPDGTVVHVRDTPGPDSGTPAVYVHGLAGSATNFSDLAGLLAVRTGGVAVDLPGFGLSQPPDGRDYSLGGQAATVEALLDRLGGRPVHLFGNSMGGAIVLLVADRRPDLVRTLTLVSPAMPDLRPDFRRVSDPRVVWASLPLVGRYARRSLASLTPRERMEKLLGLVFGEPELITEERMRLAIEEAREREAMPWAGHATGQATGAIFRDWLAPRGGSPWGKPPWGSSLWATARRVQAPTLVVWGDRDRVISPRLGPRTALALPHARLLVLPRAGHAAQMERPEDVARAALGLWDGVRSGTW